MSLRRYIAAFLFILLSLYLSVHGSDEQLFLQVLNPYDVRFTYEIRPAKNFGAIRSLSYKNIRLVPTDPADACSQVIKNGAKIKNEVAFIMRGGCSFVTKALNAEMYGAYAAVIYDNDKEASTFIDMIGDGTQREDLVEIPVYFMRGRDGYKIIRSITKNRLEAVMVNVPINHTNQVIVLNQPPWDPW